MTTHNGYGLWYKVSEVPVTGLKASGVKSIKLDKDDYVINGEIFSDNSDYITVFTDKMTAKRIKISDCEVSSRARKGLLLIRLVKTNPHKIIKSFITTSKDKFGVINIKELTYLKNSEISINDRYSTGSSISKQRIIDVFIVKEIENEEEIEIIEEKEEPKKEVSLKEIDDEILTIDDFLDDFKIIE